MQPYDLYCVGQVGECEKLPYYLGTKVWPTHITTIIVIDNMHNLIN